MVAAVGATDNRETLAGAANLGMNAASCDNTIPGAGVEAALMQSASTNGAAMTAGAAIQSFFTQQIMPARRNARRGVNRKFRQKFSIGCSLPDDCFAYSLP
jgi:hypothetical protein